MTHRPPDDPSAGEHRTADRPIPPGSTIGILGGGQLGRMLGFAARELGYRIAILDPDPDCPARAVADRQVVAAYDDVAGAEELARGCAVVTYELEHVDAALVRALGERGIPVRPGLLALTTTQDRLAERRFLAGMGVPTAPWREVRTRVELRAAAEALGYPLRLKAAIGGYDGRSQVRIGGPDELGAAFEAMAAAADRAGLLLEAELDYEAELSVVCARDARGRTLPYPVSRNVHDAGILVESVAPAPLDPAVAAEAQRLAERIAVDLGIVGLLTAELFLLADGSLAVNELAPRVHNSGHWTIEGAETSQFEQHVRAICGLPLGSPEAHGPTAMVNILGEGPGRDARLAGLAEALADPLVHVHVYDKRRVFERRKMGHVTVAGAATAEDALDRARAAAAVLSWEA
jgi:5-(carboxyamino)imidazole ribonucleotide synthase